MGSLQEAALVEFEESPGPECAFGAGHISSACLVAVADKVEDYSNKNCGGARIARAGIVCKGLVDGQCGAEVVSATTIDVIEDSGSGVNGVPEAGQDVPDHNIHTTE